MYHILVRSLGRSSLPEIKAIKQFGVADMMVIAASTGSPKPLKPQTCCHTPFSYDSPMQLWKNLIITKAPSVACFCSYSSSESSPPQRKAKQQSKWVPQSLRAGTLLVLCSDIRTEYLCSGARQPWLAFRVEEGTLDSRYEYLVETPQFIRVLRSRTSICDEQNKETRRLSPYFLDHHEKRLL